MRQRNNWQLSQATLTIFQKGAYQRMEIFNSLPIAIKVISDNPKQYKLL